MEKHIKIIIFLWLTVISIFVISQEKILLTGREILLKTIPVDPRDLFMGDYVILNYEVAQLPRRYQDDFYENQIVYVILDVDKNNIAHRKRVVNEKPESKRIFIKGQIRDAKYTPEVKFGIESYFVKEGTGLKLERDLAQGALVRVLVDRNGNAKVKGFKDIK